MKRKRRVTTNYPRKLEHELEVNWGQLWDWLE